MTIFLISSQLRRYPLIELFNLSSLLQMLNDGRMVNVKFFGNFSCSCSCKRISFNDPLNWSLSTSDGWSLCSSTSRLSSPLQNFLNHHCTVCLLAVPLPNALWYCELSLLQLILNSNKNIAQICLCLTSFLQSKKQQVMSLVKKKKKWEMPIKMMYNLTTFI